MSTWLTLLLPFFFSILGREVFLVLFIQIFINFASLRKLVHANEIFVAATLKLSYETKKIMLIILLKTLIVDTR